MNDGLATKQPTGDYATNTALNDGLASKQDTGDYATNQALTDGLANKQDTGDYATNQALTDGLANKQNTGNYALVDDIPTLAGGYSSSAVDDLLDLKADKSELVFRETGEVDANGNPVKDPDYSLSQAELGARLKLMDDTTNAKQNAGDYITRAEANEGDATAAMSGAAAGGLIGAASVVWSGVLDGGEAVTKTAGDVFKEIGDLFSSKSSGGGSSAPSIDFNSYVTKPTDWVYEGVFGGDTLTSYSERKAKNTPTLEAGNLQIKSSGVRLSSTTATPASGYKFHVNGNSYMDGEVKITGISPVLVVKKTGETRYFSASQDGSLLRFKTHNSTTGIADTPDLLSFDLVNKRVGILGDADLIDLGCDVKIFADTCVEGDLKVTGVVKNGADKPYILQEDHDQDITEITDILTDITNAIPTDENGNNQIPEGETLVFQSQITNLPTIENVDNLFDARLQSVGVVDENLALLHYDKTESDERYETSQQIDTRFTDFRTASDGLYQVKAAADNPYATNAQITALTDQTNQALGQYTTTADLTTLLADKVDNTTLANYDTSAQVDTKLSSYDTSAQVDTKLGSYDTSATVTTKIAGALLDYDTSLEVDNKITNAGVGGYWTKDATTNELSYVDGSVGVGISNPQRILHLNNTTGGAHFLRIQNQLSNDGCGIEFVRGNAGYGESTWSDWRINNTAHLDFGCKYAPSTDIPSVLHLNINGNVGIGTTVPENKLTIEGGGIQINSWNDAGDDGKYAIYSWDDVLNINPRNDTGGFTQHGFTMTKDAKIGIGINAPDSRLEVATTNADETISPDNAILSVLKDSQPGYGKYGVFVGVSNNSGYTWFQSGRQGSMTSHGTTGDTFPLVFNPNGGNIGIGTPSPSSKLHINDGGIQIDWVSKTMRIDEQHIYSKSGNYGTGFKLRDVDIHPINGDGNSTDGVCDFGTGSYRWRRYAGTYADIFTSDDRVKHNEEEVHNALETINKLKLYKYDKTAKMLDADYQGDLSDVDHLKEVGFIAQDVLEIPELAHLVVVPEDVETTVYGLDYQGIHNYLVQAVQELSVTLESEKMKNEALEARISALENN